MGFKLINRDNKAVNYVLNQPISMFRQNSPTKMWGCAEPEWRPLSQIRRMYDHYILLYHVLAGAIIFSNYWPLLRFCKLNKNNGMKNKSPSKLFIFWNDKAEFGKKNTVSKRMTIKNFNHIFLQSLALFIQFQQVCQVWRCSNESWNVFMSFPKLTKSWN